MHWWALVWWLAQSFNLRRFAFSQASTLVTDYHQLRKRLCHQCKVNEQGGVVLKVCLYQIIQQRAALPRMQVLHSNVESSHVFDLNEVKWQEILVVKRSGVFESENVEVNSLIVVMNRYTCLIFLDLSCNGSNSVFLSRNWRKRPLRLFGCPRSL